MAFDRRTGLYDGPITLGGDFPPTLNKDQDTTKLEVNETPASYGLDWDVEGILKSGSVPTGTARVRPCWHRFLHVLQLVLQSPNEG